MVTRPHFLYVSFQWSCSPFGQVRRIGRIIRLIGAVLAEQRDERQSKDPPRVPERSHALGRGPSPSSGERVDP